MTIPEYQLPGLPRLFGHRQQFADPEPAISFLDCSIGDRTTNPLLPPLFMRTGGKTMSRLRMRRESGLVGGDGAPIYAGLAFKAVRIAIGAKLGGFFSMDEPIPGRMAQLLKLLDQTEPVHPEAVHRD